MAVYRYTLNPVPNTSPQQYTASLQLTDRPIYGSKRLGSHTRPMEMVGTTPPQYYPYTQPMPAPKKRYELTDHLGNVSTVVTGKLLPMAGGGYQAEVVCAQSYEPFGSLLPGRNYSSETYRFGFQGQEMDNEVNDGVGLSYAFEYRTHDPRTGRFWSIDPLASEYPWNSPYSFAENQVIKFIELEGLERGENKGDVPGVCKENFQGGKIKQRPPMHLSLLTITTSRKVFPVVNNVLVNRTLTNAPTNVRFNADRKPKTLTFNALTVPDQLIVQNRDRNVGQDVNVVVGQGAFYQNDYIGGKYDVNVVPGNQFLNPPPGVTVSTVYNLQVSENYQKVVRRDQVKLFGFIPIPHKKNERHVDFVPLGPTRNNNAATPGTTRRTRKL